MTYKKLFIGLGIFLTLVSCNKQLDYNLNNPNYPGLSTADVDLYLNQVELSFNNFWTTASDYGAQLSRQQNWIGPLYKNGYQPASFDGMWTTAYSSMLVNASAMLPLAIKQQKFIHSGIARTLMAFTYGTLVDDFGDVPYSQAVLGAANTNPKVDGGATIYAAVQSMLDSAILDFQKTATAKPTSDLYYNGSAAKWITLAKTLKLKFYMQARLADNTAGPKIQALLTENNLINSPSQDFVFRYGTNLTAPDSRHEHYGFDYVNSGGVGEYLSNYFIWDVTAAKYNGIVNIANNASSNADPRARYYFYRQVTNYSWANQQTAPCFGNSVYGNSNFPAWYPSVPDQTPYCVVGKGYLGRDHGDNSGAPPDGGYRTAWGVYPAGGQFDYDQAASVTLGMGAGGAGINPIWLSSYTAFLEAEAALALGITTQGSARALLQSGVTASINKVINFPASIGYTGVPSSQVPTTTQINNYINLVLNSYDAAPNTDAQMNVVMNEYYIALWGNGIEAYNNLRRTGKPSNVQLAVTTPSPGFFMRSFFYPSVFVNRNSNAPAQKTPGDAANKVFWDTNPDNFIK
ncbi:MAG: SusD/RagB family nutrient-binding outer membrane lipoprotein [Sphingobacteriales bacterium]|nr:MAG: SusD/RagB family nutrient-binding outer membrane lipoprotein [Sphingobacteriales bacterium]